MSKKDKQLIFIIPLLLLCFMAVLYCSLLMFGAPDPSSYHQHNIRTIQNRLAWIYDSEFLFLDYTEDDTKSTDKTTYAPYAYRFCPADNPDIVFNAYIGQTFTIMVVPGKETVVKDDFPDSIRIYVYEKYLSDEYEPAAFAVGEINWLFNQYHVPEYYRKQAE